MDDPARLERNKANVKAYYMQFLEVADQDFASARMVRQSGGAQDRAGACVGALQGGPAAGPCGHGKR